MGIWALDSSLHNPIYAVYGFVRLADEIVDTFHDHDKAGLLEQFKKDTFTAIEKGISLNPVLHSFQKIVNEYSIDPKLIDAFLYSMEMDLSRSEFPDTLYNKYIYGSAEVVGLICLKIFVDGNDEEYKKLEACARSLGSAFQKVNFLRDMKSDFEDRGRVYFPDLSYENFSKEDKYRIEKDIENDFNHALEGIKNLPKKARFGVYTAYVYYKKLFEKIRKTTPTEVLTKRIRISNVQKIGLLLISTLRHKLGIS